MAESYIITGDRVNKLWQLIQDQYKLHLYNEFNTVLFEDGEIKDTDKACDALVKLDKIVTEHEEGLEKWDRLLHKGKTEKEIQEDLMGAWRNREAERKKAMEETQRQLNQIFKGF